MNKQQFLALLREKTDAAGYSSDTLQRSLDFYAEIIDDRIEDGMTEDEAVEAIGSADDIAAQIIAELGDGAAKTRSDADNADSSNDTEDTDDDTRQTYAAPMPHLHEEKLGGKRHMKTWEIVLLVLGSPVWIPLLAAAVIIVLSVYIVLWSVVVVLYSADLCFAAGAVVGVFGCVSSSLMLSPLTSLLFLGLGMMCAGCAILLFLACGRITRGTAWLSALPFKLFARRTSGKENI